jgi:hypothetical protein
VITLTLRDPQDVLIDADRLRQQLKKRRHSDTGLRNNRPPLAALAVLCKSRWSSLDSTDAAQFNVYL